MISITSEKFKLNFNQVTYNSVISGLDRCTLKCPHCKCSGTCIFYGTYTRYVVELNLVIHARIHRVFCKSCLTTHALLPQSLYPYFQYSIRVILTILTTQFKNISCEYTIDEGLYYRLRRQFILGLSPPTWNGLASSFSLVYTRDSYPDDP